MKKRKATSDPSQSDDNDENVEGKQNLYCSSGLILSDSLIPQPTVEVHFSLL